MTKNFKPIFTISNRFIAGLTRFELSRGFVETAKLSETRVCKIGNLALGLEAHHTTKISKAHS